MLLMRAPATSFGRGGAAPGARAGRLCLRDVLARGLRTAAPRRAKLEMPTMPGRPRIFQRPRPGSSPSYPRCATKREPDVPPHTRVSVK